jgi:predicted O-methyltransferase YrrM
MDILHPQVREYLDSLVPIRHPELQQMEAYAREHNFPIIGPASGYLCFLVARMTGARSVFELGSGYGYSTAFFARAVRENGGGVVHHVVWDEDLSRRARGHLAALGFDDLVRYHVGEAVGALREAQGPFDLIFNDIEKQDYPESLAVIETKLKPGGILIIDNMLWSGRIFDSRDTSPATVGVREFTRRITTSPEWIASLVPIRDGLIVACKQPRSSDLPPTRHVP